MKKELLKVVARLEKLEKDKIEGKKDYKIRIEQEKMDQLKSMNCMVSLEGIQTIKNQEVHGSGSKMEI